MTIKALRQTMTTLPLVALLALAGCGGGGGGSMSMNGGSTPPAQPTEQELIDRAIKRAETAAATATAAAERAADNCALLSAACADADAATAAAASAETALANARAAMTPAAAETAAADAETASGTATTAATASQTAASAPVGPAPTAGMSVNGLASSAAPKTVATDASTLETLFSTQPDNAYSPVSGALKRDFNTDTVSLDGVLHVHSVQRTSAGGYLIVYTDGQTQHTVEFGSEHCRPGYCEIRGDSYHGFWAWEASDGQPLGTPRWWHMHALNLIANPAGPEGESRIAFVFGLKTPPATLQTLGEAVYTGWFRTDAYRTGDTSSDLRQRYSGNLRIVANFDISRLYGTVIGVSGSEPGSSTMNPLPTSSFRISDGEIHDNGQFTATLTGMDSDASVPDRDSVRGVMGQILGEFYGPDGRTVGGVLTASRDLAGDENDLTFYGYIRGGKFGPTASLAADALVAGVNRYIGDRTELLVDDGMARVERTANGWSVTVDGETVTLDDADDYGALPRLSSTYWRDLGNSRSGVLWTSTGGFGSGQHFDHFDVKGWAYTIFPAGTDPATADFSEDAISGSYVHVLHGNRTPAADLPASGTATYTGSMAANDFPTDDGVSSAGPDAARYRGDATLTASFGSSSVSGRLFNLESRPGDGSTYADVQGELTFDAMIDGNRFTASAVTGTQNMAGYQSGSVRGAFFGPAAEEAGGVFDAADAGNSRAMVGWFGGDKQ